MEKVSANLRRSPRPPKTSGANNFNGNLNNKLNNILQIFHETMIVGLVRTILCFILQIAITCLNDKNGGLITHYEAYLGCFSKMAKK